MSTTYAGTPVYPVEITLPSDGDLRNAMAVNVPLEGLANRTAFLAQQDNDNRDDLQGLIADEAAAREAADTAAALVAATATADVATEFAALVNNGFLVGWPLLDPSNSVRTHVEGQTCNFGDVAHGGANWGEGFGSPDTLGSMLGTGANSYAFVPIRKLRNNATLTNVRVYLTVKDTHSGVPAVRPSVCVVRKPYGAGVAIDESVEASPDPAAYATTAAWNLNDVTGSIYIDCPCSILADDAHSYWIRINDEHGGNAIAGNRYWGALLTWEITEVQP